MSPSLLFSKPDKPFFFSPYLTPYRSVSSGLHRLFHTAEVPRPDTPLPLCIFSVPSCRSVSDEVCYQKDRDNRNRMRGRPGGQMTFRVLWLLKWEPSATMNHSAGPSAAGHFLSHSRFREPAALYLLPKTDVALHGCCILAGSSVWLWSYIPESSLFLASFPDNGYQIFCTIQWFPRWKWETANCMMCFSLWFQRVS